VADSSWYIFDSGATLGQVGSEQGVIVHDEEHPFGGRITLERAAHVAPFAITCGIYGWMMHTRFFGYQDEAEGQYDSMKIALATLLEAADKTADIDGGRQVLMDGISKFVDAYP
jgi:hypothetical protein